MRPARRLSTLRDASRRWFTAKWPGWWSLSGRCACPTWCCERRTARSAGYRIGAVSKHIPLDGPVAYGGWWVRIGYYSDGFSPVTVTTGSVSRHTTVRAGLHALYLKGDDYFESVTVSGLSDGVTLCATDVAVGRPEPVEVNQ